MDSTQLAAATSAGALLRRLSALEIRDQEITSLLDSACLGHRGPSELLCNDPPLRKLLAEQAQLKRDRQLAADGFCASFEALVRLPESTLLPCTLTS